MITDVNENKWRKKPVVVEARKLTIMNMVAIEEWCGGQIKGTKLPLEERVIDIHTLEGEVRADIGDHIIQGVKGEFYPCKPDIFEQTYVKVPPAFITDGKEIEE